MKNAHHKLVHKGTNKIIDEGNKAQMNRKLKQLNKLHGSQTHYLGYSLNKKVGDEY